LTAALDKAAMNVPKIKPLNGSTSSGGSEAAVPTLKVRMVVPLNGGTNTEGRNE
jgi:hypothetical protein